MNLLINSVNKNKYSETFIQNHVNYLPFNNYYLHGGYAPYIYKDQKLIRGFYQQIPFWPYDIGGGKLARALMDFIKKNNIHAVLSEYGPCGVEMVHVCEKSGIPLFVFFHGFDAYRENIISRYITRYKTLFNYASAIFVASVEMITKLQSLGAPVDKITCSPCGTDIEFFKPASVIRRPIFLFIGRLVPNKNPLKVIEAFSIATNECEDIKLRIIGDGELKGKCIALIRKLKMTKRIVMTGPLEKEGILKEMQQSMALILPSITMKNGEKEGTPVTIIEAGSTGLPVIATNHGGIPEVVENNRNGYLIDENDPPEKIATLMINLRNNPDLVGRLGSFARQNVVENFSLKEHINTVSTAIKNVVNDEYE